MIAFWWVLLVVAGVLGASHAIMIFRGRGRWTNILWLAIDTTVVIMAIFQLGLTQ